ncbi:EamA family transporter, partial [Actinocorallia lasiicapitis]
LLGGGGDADPLGIGLALLAGLTWAIYGSCVAALIRRGHGERQVAGATFGLAALLLLPVFAAGSTGWILTAPGLTVALYLGVITTAGAYLLYVRGLRTVPVATAMTLTLAEPAVAALIGLAFLGEHLTPAGWTGLLLVAASLALLVKDGR